jgi:hypothetical protein
MLAEQMEGGERGICWWMVDGGWWMADGASDAALQRAERERPRDQEAEAD